ncbi:hypothetical protein [Yinghuangia soli]|uniref:Uncharacterized protein n=1 Tax=Yinghuangia soli TaxID=2908204 RepID=A0AA41Q8E8_9ACTN|nr:hypothetical protein [Yinghuangia soli]MCF2532269.1 hypothetical protein [Yinghuangia soli]
MTWEHLVCANCAGPVSEGRCSVCRASRDRLARERGPQFSPALLALLAGLVVVAALLLQHLTG